jgi:hypothetical protein
MCGTRLAWLGLKYSDPDSRLKLILYMTHSLPNLDSLLDEGEACRHLRITPRLLRHWRRNLGLPHLRLTQKTLRYRRSDLDRWADKRRVAVLA